MINQIEVEFKQSHNVKIRTQEFDNGKEKNFGTRASTCIQLSTMRKLFMFFEVALTHL